MKLPLLVLLPLATSCSLALDFDDVTGLPCPCDDQHVCIRSSDTCVPRASVDDFKACSTDTEPPGGDLLCKGTSICQDVNNQGPRCLPPCAPQSYALPEASVVISEECPRAGTTCWPTARGGVCSEGLCETTPGSCGPSAECQVFNGAGICFTICEIYSNLEDPCAGGLTCHPIGATQTTACIMPGVRERTEVCSLSELCRSEDELGRNMVCSRPQAAPSATPRCYPICRPGGGDCLAGSCTQAASGRDRINDIPVHICDGEPGPT